MKLSYQPFEVQLKHTFSISGNSRTSTPIVLTQIEYNGIIGYGEASMPPYLGEDHNSVISFLKKVKLDRFSSPFLLEDILSYVDSIAKKNFAAKASVDIALHDLVGKLIGKPWYELWGYDPLKSPYTSYTIGIASPEEVIKKTKEVSEFKILKIKLGGENDREMIETIRKVTSVNLCVDANQGWSDKYEALEMIHWLKEQGVVFVEQPMPINKLEDMAWLTQHSPLPTIADEEVKRLSDLKQCYGAYSGVNIKLMKCTGMREAHKMVDFAKAVNIKVMLGCMTETSCAISAMSHLAPACDWADLDGSLLTSNDCFLGMTVKEGKVVLPTGAGIGATPIN